ncbi:MAG: Holliday junction branch migration protein RuvA [Candidatus Omnitrophota bacterium]
MIARISGKVIEKGDNYLILDTGGICYEVFIPQTVMQRLEENIKDGCALTLKTFHYFQVEPSKTTPVLIGFLNDIEKDFFEIFITVSGIGPRAALRALNKPISEIAQAIDSGDLNFLRSLPGIGEQRAKEIIAKLQNKVAKFGLIKNDKIKEKAGESGDTAQEVLAVLMQLGYKKPEAAGMIKTALEKSPDIQTTEELLNVVYKQRKSR